MSTYSHAPSIRRRSNSRAPSIHRRLKPRPTAATNDTDGPQQMHKILDGCRSVVPAVTLVLESDEQCPATTRTPEADEGATCMCPYDSTSTREAIYDQGKTGPAFKWVRPYGAPPQKFLIPPTYVRHPDHHRACWLSSVLVIAARMLASNPSR